MELNQDFSSLFNSNSPGASQPAPAPAAPSAAPSGLTQDFSSVFAPQQQSQTTNASNTAKIDDVLASEGATALKPLVSAFYGQESSSGANPSTSVDGAHGGMQITPGTFAQFAKPGESIDNPAQNMAVGTRILAHYAQQYGGDPAKIAVAYFSGPGNVATDGPTPWKHDFADSNGTKVSQYVQGIQGRMGGASIAPQQQPDQPEAPAAADVSQAPKWTSIVSNPAFQKMSPQEQQQTSEAYFQKWIAPNVSPDQLPAVQAEWAAKSAAAQQAATPSTFQNIKNGIASAASSALNTVAGATDGVSQDGVVQPALAAQAAQPTAGVLGDGQNLPAQKGLPPQPFVTPAYQQQVFNAYDAATPAQRVGMTQQPGVAGQVAQLRAAQYANNTNPASSDIGTSVEDRTARLNAAGVAPDAAAAQAKQQAASGTPTQTPNYMEPTNFDFDASAKYANANPLVRGVVKGVLGAGQAAVGLGQFESDMLGADVPAAKLNQWADSLRGTAQGIGEPADGFSRNLESATSGLVQLAPAMLGGAFVEGMNLAPLAQNFFQTFGQTYSDGRAAGQDPTQATTRAGMMGAFAILGHAVGLDSKLESIRQSVAGAATEDIATSLWNSTLRDLPSTQAMALGNFITDKLPGGVGLSPEAKFTDWLHQAGDMAVQTVMMNGMLGAGTIGGAPLARTLRGEVAPSFDESSNTISDKNGNYWNIAPNKIEPTLNAPGAPGTSGNGPHPSQAAADQAVQNIAAIHGIDASSLIPEATPVPQPVAQPAAPEPAAPTGQQPQQIVPQAGQSLVWSNGTTDVPVIYHGVAPDRGPDGRLYAQVGFNGQMSYVPFDELHPGADTSTASAPAAQEPTTPAESGATDQQVLEFAKQRLDMLREKQSGSIDTTMPATGGEDVKVPGQALSPTEKMEFEALRHFGNDPAALANFYGLRPADTEPSAPSADVVNAAAHEAATSPENDTPEPTQAQKEAGNYAKGHVQIHGMDVSIENPQGSERSGTDADGVVWKNTLQDHYGYIKRTVGADDEHIDTFVGQNPASRKVFIVDQNDPNTGKFDEHKVMLGYDSMAEADAAYHRNYEPGWNGRGAISELPIGMFKEWLEHGDTKSPFVRDASPSMRKIVKSEEPAPVEKAPVSRELDTSAAAVRALQKSDKKFKQISKTELLDAHPESGPAGQLMRGYLDARDGLPLDPVQVSKPTSNMKLTGFNPIDYYRSGYFSQKAQRSYPLRTLDRTPTDVQPAPKTEREAKARKQEKVNGSSTEAQGRASDGAAQEGAADRAVAGSQGGAEEASATSGSADATGSASGTGDGSTDSTARAGGGVQPGADGSERGTDAGNVKPKTEKEAKARKAKSKPANDSSYGANNKTFTADAATKARETLRKKLGQLNAGLDPDMMRAGLMLAGFHIEAGARKFADYAKAMVGDIGENIRPYLRGFYENVRHYPGFDNEGMTPGHEIDSGAHEAIAQKVAEKPQEVAVDKAGDTAPKSLVDHFYNELTAGRLPKDNVELRKAVAAFDGAPVDNARLKEAQEDLEAALAHRARDVVAQGKDDSSTYESLVSLYHDQPNLNIRTSTSIENQAYSTPAPLAYVAAKLAGIDHETTVYEPTAGNGMLLLTADPKNVTANELEDQRFANLKAQGFDAIQGDALHALTSGAVVAGSQDAVIANPPFGSVKDDAGKATKVSVDGYKIGKIDHLIAAEALRAMKDDGKATLILGADKEAGGLGTDDRIFFNWLYGNYHVTSHFEVDGKLYGRQGANWPVRVITLDGRGKSKQVSPRAGTIARVDNWNDVYEQYRNGLDAQKSNVAAAEGRALGTGEPAPVDDAKPAAVVAGKQDSADGSGQPEGSATSVGDVGGNGARAVGDRPAKPDAGLAESDRAQRRNAKAAQSDQLDDGSAARADATDAGNAGSEGTARGDRVVSNDADNQFQTKYVPRSGRKDEGVLIPVNMAGPTQDALNRLEDEVGNIDKYAARELGYDSTAQLHDALMGLQVDSVASAIRQIGRGKGTIIADQTGIGKGRQAAAIIRWAARQGHIPVFVTVKPQLFTDMYGDLADIGTHDINPFIMNSDAWVSGPGGNKLFANKASQHRKNIDAITSKGKLPDGSNALFMTYSQINKENPQRAAVLALADKAVFVLDESHNAGGESSTGDFIKGALDAARGAVYLSATYAKRPDNMPVYFKTDIGDAISDDDSLIDAMAAGGLPLQTVVANNLVKAGQMFRRERSYDGVSIQTHVDTARKAQHEKMSDAVTEALRGIVDADKAFHAGHVAQMKEDAAQQGAAILDIAGNQASASVNHTEFSSVVHNFVRQMLLGLKADEAADKAIAALKANEKPLIALENTMGSFLAEYADNNGIKPGQPLGAFDYRTVLSRALDRTRYVVVQHPNGEKEKQYIPLDKLDSGTRAEYAAAQKTIDKLKLDIPVSPLDWMRHRLEQAGYSVAEITGRNLSVDYSEGKPKLSQLSAEEQTDKVGTTRKFNDGSLDALILNVAGSTGISLHASEKFKDQRQRHMIVAQPAQDINIFMQMLGRIHRTGQVVLPKYSILNVDLPAEMRPTALLSKKMKSLNANTSSNTESATSIKAPDMLNQYGDQVIGQYLDDNMELRLRLGVDGLDSNGNPQPDLARKATGRLALMPVETQHAFYNEVGAQYETLIDYLNRTNQNELEPRTFDYDAKETRSEVLHQGDNPETPFGEDAYYGEYSIKAQGKPMTPEEIRDEAKASLGSKTQKQHAEDLIATLKQAFEEGVKRDRERNGLGKTFDADKYRKALKATNVEPTTAARMVEEQTRHYQQHGMPADFNAADTDAMGATAAKSIAFINEHYIGSMWRVEINGEMYNAAVTDLKSTHKSSGNPFSMSKLKVSLALNGSLRHVTLPATQFHRIEVSDLKGSFDNLFRVRPGNEREKAKIVTGNLLAAYGELTGTKGTIVNFTKSDNTTEQGILLPKKFDYTANTRGDYRLKSAADAVKFLQGSDNPDVARFGIASRDGVVRVTPEGRDLVIQVPKSKAKGGKYFLDKALTSITGDFVSRSKYMEATVRGPKAADALDVLMNKAALYALPSMAEEARGIVGDPKPVAEGATAPLAMHRDINDMAGFARTSGLSAKPEAERTSALTTLRRLSSKLEAGDITDAEFRLGTQQLLAKLEDKRDGQLDRKADRVRERGDLYIRERLLRAVRQGDIEQSTADFAQWLLDKNPAIADDLGIGVRKAPSEESMTAGQYNPAARVLTLFKGNTNTGTAVHEILHHTERMMPDDVRAAIYKAWSRDFKDAYAKATPEQKPLFAAMLMSALGSQKAWEQVAKGFSDGKLDYDQHYKLVNASEYWAVKATDLLQKRYDAQGNGWIARAKQWLKEMVQKVKSILGLASDTPIIDGMKSVLDGEGDFKAQEMMTDREPGQPAAAFRDLVNKTPRERADEAYPKIADTLIDKNKSVKTFGWWDKSLGTQLNKALKDEHYGRVFDTARKLHNTVATAAVRPSEQAPDVLPHTADFRQNVSKLFAGTRQSKQQKMATQALLDGTLAGDGVMSGKIWSEKHLEQVYGLNAEGKRIYNQTRNAVDASLDEVAASEAWGLAQGFVPKEMRELIIDNPNASQRLIRESIDSKIAMLSKALDAAVVKGEEERAGQLQALITPYEETRQKVEDVYEKAEFLKSAGYLPLMRFGKFSVYAYKIDPETGEREVDPETGAPMTAYFGLFPTEAEAKFEADRQSMLYADDPTVQVQRGVKSEKAHQLYEGLSPETMALFADKVGAQETMKQVIQLAMSERSALKRRLERQGIAGFSQDLPRILSNFLTSNARFAGQRYYMRDLNRAIADIPNAKGDVMDEAIALKQYMMNGGSAGNNVTAVMFAWYLAGSPISAATIVTELPLKTIPYMMQHGIGKGLAAVMKALPYGLGKKEIKDPEYRAAVQRATREGIVKPQEIFHLYELGAQNVATWLSSQLARLPLIKDPVARSAEGLRARFSAFMTITGMLHSMAESFNRRMAFHSAWHLGKSIGAADPYKFAANATDETSGIYAKYNRPNAMRSTTGRVLLAFKHWEITYFEMIGRMIRRGGAPMARVLGTMLIAQMAASGVQGFPFMQNLDDVVDTIGNVMGYNTDFSRFKRELAEGALGHKWGDALMHGLTRLTPIDMSSHLEMGHIIPGTDILKLSNARDKMRSIADAIGPAAGIVSQLGDAYDAATSGSVSRTLMAIAPTAPKHIAQGINELNSGQSVDFKGRKMADATPFDAASRMIGGRSPEVAQSQELRSEINQAVSATKVKQAQILGNWARAQVQGNEDGVNKAIAQMQDWNAKNPDTPVIITRQGLIDQMKQMTLDANTRALVDSPRAMKGAVSNALRGAGN